MKTTLILFAILPFAVASHAGEPWDKTEAAFMIARLYHAGDYGKAELAAKDYFEKTGHPMPDVWLLYARTLIARGQMETAMSLLADATKQFPDDYRFWQLIGETLVRQGGGAKAVSALQRAVALNPKDAASYLWLAKASYGSAQRTHWLNTVLLLEPSGSSLAKEAAGMIKEVDAGQSAQPTTAHDVVPAEHGP